MSTTPFTVIPSSQPSCGDISASQPIPHCPNTTATTATTTPANPDAPGIAGEPMGCFIQANGLFCAPIATTRGFLYTLDSTQQQQQQQQQQQRGVLSFLVPRLSTATNNNNNNNATLVVGVDGRPVNYQGPARLGEACYPIPLPPVTDPLFQTLVAVANRRLNETLGSTEAAPTPGGSGGGREWYRSPGVGAGEQVFNFRGDCEQGSYCDFVPAGAGGAVVTGTCKEVLPNFHNCTSYAQCSSFRCDRPWTEGGRNSTAGNANGGGAGVTVCLPSKLDHGNANNGGSGGGGPGGGGGGGNDKPSKFPAWIGGIIAIVVVFGAAIAFGLVRRRKKMAADKEKKSLKKRRRSARSQASAAVAAATAAASPERDRKRSMSLPLHSHHQGHEHQNHLGDDNGDDKESDYVYQLHSGKPSLIVNEKQELSASERGSGGGFGRWFRRSRTEDQMDSKELGGENGSVTTESSRSSFRSTSSLGRDGEKPRSPITKEGHGVPLNALGAAVGGASEESIHSDSTTAVALESANPRSRLSVNIPRIVTTPSDSAIAAATSAALRAYAEGEERDVVATGLSHHSNKNNNLNNRPSFSSATTSSSLNESGTSSSSPPPSDLSRRSSNHAFLAATSSSNTPPPGSPVSPISPISPRPTLSSAPSSRSSQRSSLQLQQQLGSSSHGARRA